MRALSEFLSEREIYIYENHPQVSYAKLATELGITGNRVAQIKHNVIRKIRDEKVREQREQWAKETLLLSMSRGECLVILRALSNYEHRLTPGNYKARLNPNYQFDPDLETCKALINRIQHSVSGK